MGVGRGNFCDSLCPYLRSSFTKKMYTCWLNVHVCTDFAPLRTATCVHAQRKLVLNHKLLSVSSAPSASQGPGACRLPGKGAGEEKERGGALQAEKGVFQSQLALNKRAEETLPAELEEIFPRLQSRNKTRGQSLDGCPGRRLLLHVSSSK